MSYLIDVNVWVALTVRNHVHHESAAAWFSEGPVHSAAFCRVTQMGLLRMLTNKHVMGTGALSMVKAWEIYSSLLADERIFFASEPDRLEDRWRSLCADARSPASHWTDFYLAGFAQAAKMTLVTFDRRFQLVDDLRSILLANIA